jgi:hypothetical protein
MTESKTTMPANGMPMCNLPNLPIELPEYPPDGQTVYIPHVWRDGSKAPTEMFSHTWACPGMADPMGCAFTIKRTGNIDTFIPCGCGLCYERWSYRRRHGR